MGREIRKVPADWDHPRDDAGYYKRLYDMDFESAVQRWVDERALWLKGEHEDQNSDDPRTTAAFIDNGQPFPDQDYYRERTWTPEEATCYQIYEDVSEGTPVSPIFKTSEDLVLWLVDQGYSPKAAKAFAEKGWAPSFVIMTGGPDRGLYKDIESAGIGRDDEPDKSEAL